MKIETLYHLFTKCSGITTDSRKIQKGNLFFALKGDNFNGNSFAEEALNKGAEYAIIDEKKYQTKNTLLVKNVLKTLQKLANFHRKKLNIPIIALTGSNGKTTTKELINSILKTSYTTTATTGNLNNHIGVPLTLLSMTKKTEIGIVEMGANHIKEIETLCKIAEPNYGYITNFGKAHLEGFGGIKGVIKGKSELYQFLKDNNGIAFINTDDEVQIKQSKNNTTVNFNKNSVTFIEATPLVSVKFKNQIIKSNLIWNYNYLNLLAAISIGNYFKVPLNKISLAIESYIPTNNRSQIIKKGSNQIILDAYNANPTSMALALENFNQLKEKNKVVFLGDMFEIGVTSNEEHQKIVDLVTTMKFAKVFLIGKAFFATKTKNALLFKSLKYLKDSNTNMKFENSCIFIKGSRGMALEQILDFL